MILTVAIGLFIGFGLGRSLALPAALAALAGISTLSAAAHVFASDFAPASASLGFVVMVTAGQVGYVLSKAREMKAQMVRERSGKR